jgi:hypothetical protein
MSPPSERHIRRRSGSGGRPSRQKKPAEAKPFAYALPGVNPVPLTMTAYVSLDPVQVPLMLPKPVAFVTFCS